MSRFGFGLGFGASFGSGGGGIPLSIQRNFTTLDSAFSMYYTIPAVTLMGDFEIECDMTASSTGDQAIFDQTDLNSAGNVLLYIDDPNGLEIVVGNGVGFDRYSFGGNASIRDGKLNHIRLTRVGTTVTAYLNSVQVGSTHTISSTLQIPSTMFGGFGRYLDGVGANVKITDNSTLVRDYPIDETWVGPSTALNDRSGNNQHGTAVNIDTDDSDNFTFDGVVSPNTWTNDGATRVIEVAGT